MYHDTSKSAHDVCVRARARAGVALFLSCRRRRVEMSDRCVVCVAKRFGACAMSSQNVTWLSLGDLVPSQHFNVVFAVHVAVGPKGCLLLSCLLMKECS